VAFDIHEGQEEAIAVVAEAVNPKALPDPLKIATAIRNHLNVEVGTIAVIASRAIPKTSSGKIQRHMAKQMWLEKKFRVLCEFSRTKSSDQAIYSKNSLSPFEALKARYHLTGSEPYTLVEAGLDSLDIVVLAHEIKNFLEEKGAGFLAGQINIRLTQQITIAELFRLVDHFEQSPEAAILQLRSSLLRIQEEGLLVEKKMMSRDRTLSFEPAASVGPLKAERADGGILLTGGTGFVGPFLLKSLLEQTSDPIYVLIRAADQAQGMERLKAAAIEAIAFSAAEIGQVFEGRVIPVCGDLGHENLGLTTESWKFLASNVHTIYHNGAAVNYLFNYDSMRDVNVTGTNQVLKLAFEHHFKIFNYVSTTFIFGWAVKDVLYETDSNEAMELLDFGYSQSKWVAERIVEDAAKKGLMTRIFRPALVTPSVPGGGNNIDIAIRLLAFMFNHGIGVDALNQVSFVPADVAANNIVAISNLPETVNGTYHVTRDDYANMVDITNIITNLTGQPFELFKLPKFVPEVIKRCTKNDLLFPLLDFLTGSVNSISSMEFKQYDSSSFQKARNMSKWGKSDPSLEDTVRGILRYMKKKGIVSVGNV
jgi:thioester reductase-like protein